MTITRQQRNSETSEAGETLKQRLQQSEMLTMTQNLFAKDLSSEESSFWAEFLKAYSIPELQYAFDNWNRNGRFFPKPKDIIDLIDAFRLSQKKEKLGNPACDAECKARHGKGYGEQDVLWFMRNYLSQRERLQRKLSRTEIFSLFDELDKRRGSSPEWRKTA